MIGAAPAPVKPGRVSLYLRLAQGHPMVCLAQTENRVILPARRGSKVDSTARLAYPEA